MKLIPLGSSGQFAKVSNVDFVRANKVKWYLCKCKGGPYAYTDKRRSPSNGYGYLHQFIMNARGIDHKNGDGLDCRRSNLRVATQSQNNANRAVCSNSKTGVKGVSKCKQTGLWIAYICYNYKKINLGRFTTIEAAAAAYNRAARKLFGEFAYGSVQAAA